MKKLDKLTLFEIEELAEFQDHIGSVIGDMNEYEEYVPKLLHALHHGFDRD